MSLTFTSPRDGERFPFGETVELQGTANADVARIDLVADRRFTLPAVTLRDGRWFVAHRFPASGERIVVATGFDAESREVGRSELRILVAPPDFGRLVPIPREINRGVSEARQATMLEALGRPGALSQDCTPVTNPGIRRLLVTSDVGPFRVQGIGVAVEALRRIFEKVRQREPELSAQLGTAGMLCCRRVRRRPGRPPSRNFSNHSWGTAVDIKIRDTLDPRGDGQTQLGLLVLHPFFNEEGFFWGAGFRGEFEDSMHFEASDELVRDWKRRGLLDA